MTIQIDSREKARAIGKILKQFDDAGVKHYTSKLFVGDYMSLDNPRLIIDRKQSLQELCGNVCQEHARFKAEMMRAKEVGIKLIILCEHSPHIKCIEDVKTWENPRIKTSPKATTGERLYKTLITMSNRYGIEFLFCSKAETGNRIIELLS